MNRPSSPSAKNSKIDGSAVLRAILNYEEFWVLMLLLLAFGLLSGTVYYVYARPTFSSASNIRINQYFDTTQVAQGAAKEINYLRMRALMDQLRSGYMILAAGRQLGFADSKTTYDELKVDLIPAVRVAMLDQAHLELTVVGYDRRLIREFPEALVLVYEEEKARLRSEFRDKAIQRYMDELTVVREKVISQLESRLQFEEDSSLASAQIELEKLSDVPVDLVRVRYRLEEMEHIREILNAQSDALGTVGRLSLLTSLSDRGKDSLASGRIVRTTGDPRNSPLGFESPQTKKEYTQVVVQPDMVEGLEPWRELEKRKRALEEEIRLMRTKFLDDHPEMLKLREELASVSSGLELELEVADKGFKLEYEQLREEISELESKLPDYHKATKSYDQKRLDYELLKKGQLAWDKAYEQLAQQIEGLQFGPEDGSLDLEFRGFTNLRDDVPVSPNKMKLFTMSLLLGLGLAGGVPFVLKKLDSSVADLAEFETSLGIPGIGLIPLGDPKELESINRSPVLGAAVPNSLLENFRLIRSSIMLNRSPKGEAKVVMLTSARPSEGKTTIAANVAWAFSSLGERTLLIDCDLRRGRIHQVANISNERGMTGFLTGRESLDDCLAKSETDNLWVIPRGPVLPGSTELLNTPVFSTALEKLKGEFDRIILDTPPVLGLSETAFLHQHAEGVVLVVRSRRTRRSDVEDAFHALGKLGAHFYGFVLNGVDFSKKANLYQYYYYSANYYEDEWALEEPSRAELSPKEDQPAVSA